MNPNCNGHRHDKVALRATCIKNVKLKIIKTRTGCQYVGYFYYSENLNWAAQNPRLGRLTAVGHSCFRQILALVQCLPCLLILKFIIQHSHLVHEQLPHFQVFPTCCVNVAATCYAPLFRAVDHQTAFFNQLYQFTCP